MLEALIEAALPLLPSLMIGWVASVSVGDAQLETEPWYKGWLRWFGTTVVCEVFGFALCRFVWRFVLMML